jgi:HD-like signal output (HDOD) protein
MNEFWKHAIGVGIASETIAKFVSHPMPADLFTCGLVHDMGKVALYTIEPDAMLAIIAHASKNDCTYSEAESALGIPSHTKIGQMLSAKWKLPNMIQVTIAYHHAKETNQRGGITPDQHRNVDIVFLANLLTHAMKFGKSGHDKILGAPKDIMERLTLNPEQHLKPLLNEIRTNFEKAADFLRVLGGGQ